MFKVNKKDTRTIPLASFRSLLLTYFTPCPNVTIANFEHVIANWEESQFG